MTTVSEKAAWLGTMVVAMATLIGNAGGVTTAELWQTRSLPSNDGYAWTLTSRIGNMLKVGVNGVLGSMGVNGVCPHGKKMLIIDGEDELVAEEGET